ncbi:MAG: stage V sporulation protein AB [Bacillota bacterium]
MVERAILIFAGLGQGLLVSAAAMLIVTILDILPRFSMLSGMKWGINVWAAVFAAGLGFTCLGSLFGVTLDLPAWTNAVVFMFCGAYVGILLMALAETLDLFPASLGKIVPSDAMKAVLILLVIGKIAGSIMYWLFPQLWK